MSDVLNLFIDRINSPIGELLLVAHEAGTLRALDWADYLLLRCTHCHAVFESEQLRYEVGAYNYGDGTLCPPYELFPLCPYCGASGWCPAEDARVAVLRTKAARREAIARVAWIAITVVLIIVVTFVALNVLR